MDSCMNQIDVDSGNKAGNKWWRDGEIVSAAKMKEWPIHFGTSFLSLSFFSPWTVSPKSHDTET